MSSNSRKLKFCAGVSLGVLMLAVPLAAQAQIQLGPVQVEGAAPDANPYADPAAPYKADKLSSSKFTEPVVNTPRSETIITKEALDDTNRTSFRDVARSTAGVTLGTGEGGNSFGDRFFIRGVDARNDIFIDGVRDPGVLIRENFNVEQIEILKGPASSFAGRGTAGGAVNLVSKQARPGSFYDFEATGGPIDNTLRLTADVNQQVTDTLSVRVNGMIQNANVAGRDFTSDNRWGIAGAVTWTPLENLTITGGYSYTFLHGLPDMGVPYNAAARRPVTSGDVRRDVFYGAVNRDFIRSVQGQGSVNIAWAVTDWLTLENNFHTSNSTLHYIATIPEDPSPAGATAIYSARATTPPRYTGYTQLNAQSRYEPVTVLVDQPQATFYFKTGAIKHTTVVGGEFSAEHLSFVGYTGLTSELTTGATAFTSAGAPIVPVTAPANIVLSNSTPTLNTNPQRYKVNTSAGYILHTANFNDLFIFNLGVRFDDYKISSANNTASQTAHSGITSFNAGLVVKPVENVSVYGAFATAAEPVGAEIDGNSSSYGGLSPTQPTGQVFGPQKSKSYEVGVKWEMLDGHLLATGAFFQTDISNAREGAPAGLPGYTSGQIVPNAAYTIRGWDFSLAGNITEDWSVQAGVVLMNPEVTNSIVPSNIGLQLSNIAPESFNLLTKYNVTNWLAVGGQAVYASEIQGGTLLAANGGAAYPNAPYPTILPAYWRGDLFAEGIVTDNVLVRLNVQNVFDTTYYDSLYQSAVPFVHVAPGRSVSISAEVKF